MLWLVLDLFTEITPGRLWGIFGMQRFNSLAYGPHARQMLYLLCYHSAPLQLGILTLVEVSVTLFILIIHSAELVSLCVEWVERTPQECLGTNARFLTPVVWAM